MARGRKTSKPKVASYQKVPRDNDPLGVYAVLDHCLDTHRRDLKNEECRIALAWRFGLKRNKDGQLVLGKCAKVSQLHQEYAGFDFIIILNNEAWKELDGEQREADVAHGCEKFGVSVPGVRETQWLDGFIWLEAEPLEQP